MQNATAIVSEYEENVQNPVPHGPYDEEVDRDQILAWLLRNARQVGEGGLRLRTM